MLVIVISALICGCSTTPELAKPSESQKALDELKATVGAEIESHRPENVAARDKHRREQYVNAHPELEQKTKDVILSGMLGIGMTSEQVEASCGKPPYGVNSTVTAYGKHEQWCYEDLYLYFDNGILVSFQKLNQ